MHTSPAALAAGQLRLALRCQWIGWAASSMQDSLADSLLQGLKALRCNHARYMAASAVQSPGSKRSAGTRQSPPCDLPLRSGDGAAIQDPRPTGVQPLCSRAEQNRSCRAWSVQQRCGAAASRSRGVVAPARQQAFTNSRRRRRRSVGSIAVAARLLPALPAGRQQLAVAELSVGTERLVLPHSQCSAGSCTASISSRWRSTAWTLTWPTTTSTTLPR